jgi:hypothetical protein
MALVEATPGNSLNYDDWISLGLAMKQVLGSWGKVVWLLFSEKYGEYSYEDAITKWDGFKPDGRSNAGTIIHFLKKSGLLLEVVKETARELKKNVDLRLGTTLEIGDAPNMIAPTLFMLPNEANIPPRDWVYGRFLIRGFLSLTVAPGGMGKSALSISESLALASGRPLMGEYVEKPLRVWLWNGEDPTDELDRRIAAACRKFELSKLDLSDRLMVDSGRNLPIKIATYDRDGLQLAEPLIAGLIAAIQEHKIDVLKIDPFVTSHQVPENDNGPMNDVIDAWRRIASETNCAIELIHHVNKSAALNKDQGVYGARGAGALIDGVRAARFLERMGVDDAAKLGLESQFGYFRVVDGKSNMAPPAEKAAWCQIVDVPLENGDHVGVCTPWELPKPSSMASNEQTNAILLAISECNKPPHSSEKSIDGWVGNIVARKLNLGIGVGLKTSERDPVQNAGRGKVRAFITHLQSIGLIEVDKSCKDSRAGRNYSGMRVRSQVGQPQNAL